MNHIKDIFTKAGQSHVFAFWEGLSPDEQQHLASQAENIDLTEVEHLVQNLIHNNSTDQSSADTIEPAFYIPLPSSGGDIAQWKQATELGDQALQAGRVAAFTVAGGQGTRLGFDGPKGTFPVTPVAGNSLFQLFAEKILASSHTCGNPIPWFIMTSALNHEATTQFFQQHDYFGLRTEDVHFFSQGTMPAVDAEGKILMESRSQIALSPDGHGGALRALVRSGATQTMEKLGIDLLSYFQVDNPLIRCIDPSFIGFHLLQNSELSSKACLKAYPEEKVGIFVEKNGTAQVLEYSDLPDDLIHATDPDGQLRFRAGSIAIHIFSRNLIERMGSSDQSDLRLPFHKAHKKVPTINTAGDPVSPGNPNGYKFEMFVFDALPFAQNPVIVETARADDFSPVKNAPDAKFDTAATSKADQLRQHARWAIAAGLEIETDDTGLPTVEFEISPLFANTCEEFIAKASNITIEDGMVLS